MPDILLLASSSPLLEVALQQERKRRHMTILNALYQASVATGTTPIEVAQTVTRTVAHALQVVAELWWMDSSLQRVFATSEDQVLSIEHVSDTTAGDWLPYFYEQPPTGPIHPHSIPAVARLPQRAFAWLPLVWQEQRFGALALIYPQRHHFSDEERSLLKVFAQRCSIQLYYALRSGEVQRELAQFQSWAQQRDMLRQTAVRHMQDTLAQFTRALFHWVKLSTDATLPQTTNQIYPPSPSNSTSHAASSLLHTFAQLMASYNDLPMSLQEGESSPGQINKKLMQELDTILQQSEQQ